MSERQRERESVRVRESVRECECCAFGCFINILSLSEVDRGFGVLLLQNTLDYEKLSSRGRYSE